MINECLSGFSVGVLDRPCPCWGRAPRQTCGSPARAPPACWRRSPAEGGSWRQPGRTWAEGPWPPGEELAAVWGEEGVGRTKGHITSQTARVHTYLDQTGEIWLKTEKACGVRGEGVECCPLTVVRSSSLLLRFPLYVLRLETKW